MQISSISVPVNNALLNQYDKRQSVAVQDLKKGIGYGDSKPPLGDFHETLLETVRTHIKYHQDLLLLDVGGGIGYVAADVALLIANQKNCKGKVLVSEPILFNEANQYIFGFLKNAGIKGIKDFYTVSALAFPECTEKVDQSSDFKKSFDIIHCKNVIHFLPPKVADLFFDHLFKSLKPGGHLFLHANAPYQSFGILKGTLENCTSSLEYYKYWKGIKEYPGYCSMLDLYAKSSRGREWMQSGNCYSSYPSDYEKPEEYACPKNKVLGTAPTYSLESVETIKNFFTVEQLESLAEKHAVKIVESGYIKAERTSEGMNEVKLPRDVDLKDHGPLCSYIILQKPER